MHDSFGRHRVSAIMVEAGARLFVPRLCPFSQKPSPILADSDFQKVSVTRCRCRVTKSRKLVDSCGGW